MGSKQLAGAQQVGSGWGWGQQGSICPDPPAAPETAAGSLAGLDLGPVPVRQHFEEDQCWMMMQSQAVWAAQPAIASVVTSMVEALRFEADQHLAVVSHWQAVWQLR